MDNNKKIEIINVDIGYQTKKNKTILLSGINLTAEAGDNIALIGVNGSGKSTLLRSISGSQALISGDINIENKNVSKYSPVDLAKKLAIVSSEIINSKYLKVKDLVSLGRFPHQSFSKKMTKTDTDKIDESLELTGIFHLLEKKISEISDGERQKVMIARALTQDTDIILLDEPTAFLDIENKYSVYDILSKTASEKNKTIIFSTHDLNIALKHADKIWLIKNKKIHEGAPEDLILQNTFTNLFNNKNVFFNNETNEFSVQNKKKYSVNFIDNSSLKTVSLLTVSALRRKSFYVDTSCKKITIRITPENYWEIITKKESSKHNTIYNLLKSLLKLKDLF